MERDAEIHFLQSALSGSQSQVQHWKRKWEEDVASWRRIAHEYEDACKMLEARGAAYAEVTYSGVALMEVLEGEFCDDADAILKAAELDNRHAMASLLCKVEALKLKNPALAMELGFMV